MPGLVEISTKLMVKVRINTKILQKNLKILRGGVLLVRYGEKHSSCTTIQQGGSLVRQGGFALEPFASPIIMGASE